MYLQVIAAEGEQKASKSLAEASQVMSESSAALHLRYLQVRGGEGVEVRIVFFSLHFQTLNSISAEKNSTIIFPLPMDLIKNVLE
jgi:erythrocyte band 7 integral membrane protein